LPFLFIFSFWPNETWVEGISLVVVSMDPLCNYWKTIVGVNMVNCTYVLPCLG
jgi:hypothetical protein